MDNETIITSLLNSAEQLFERGMLKMCAITLEAIAKRTEHESLSELDLKRFLSLCESVPDEEEQSNQSVCHKCRGKKVFSSGMCFACMGKGFQSERDKIREQDYWSRRDAPAKPFIGCDF